MGTDRKPVACPFCRSAIRIREDEFVGRAFRCPECSRDVRLVNGELIGGESRERRSIASYLGPSAVAVFVLLLIGGIVAVIEIVPPPVKIEPSSPRPELVRRETMTDEQSDSHENLTSNRLFNIPTEDQDVGSDDQGWNIPQERPSEKVPRSLLPPAVVEAPAVQRTRRSSDAANQAAVKTGENPLSRLPIDVPIVPWNREDEPISVNIEGGLVARSESRMDREVTEFRTGRPTQLHVVIETLAELAGVPLLLEGRWPTREVTARFERASIDLMIRELLEEHDCKTHINPRGELVVQCPTP